MARRPWTPLPHEAELFCNVYVDESSQTKFRYLVLGGLVIPHSHYDAFEADIAAVRDYTTPVKKPNGTPNLIKWQKVCPYNVGACKKIVDAFYSFPQRSRLPAMKNIDIHCVVVDTSKKPLKDEGDGDLETGFNKQVYFLCTVLIGKRFKRELFHIYPDRRTSPQPLWKARAIMNQGAKKYGDKRLYPFRRLRYHDPENCQSLQVVDLFIGALAYKLNGHYDKPNANAGKKQLCDYILNRAKIKNPLANTLYYKRRFSIVHRPSTPAAAIR